MYYKNNDLSKKSALRVNDVSFWETMRNIIVENQDFYDNNKMNYINRVVASDYTVNYDLIPIIPLPITSYMTKIKSNHYNKAYILESANQSDDFKKFISFNKLKLALSRMLINYHLHSAGFVRPTNPKNKNSKKLHFDAVNPMDMQWNYAFTEVLCRIGHKMKGSMLMYRYEFYSPHNDIFKRIEFIAGDWGTFDPTKLGEEIEVVSTSFFDYIPIVALFKTEARTPQKSVFVHADLILNILLGFGMANVPTALLVKIWVKNSGSRGVSMGDKLDALSDIMDVLPLGEKEDVGTLETGNLMSFQNFFSIFESLLTHISQLEGIPRSAVQIANPTRQSGASKQTDNRSSSIYRDLFIMELDDFEERLFEVINSLLKKDYEFMNIDKGLTITLSSREILDEMVIAVTNGFEDFVVAIAKYKKISLEDARKKLDEIMASREKYGDLLVGIAGMPMSDGGNVGDEKKENKKEEGIYKGDKENEQADKTS